MKKKIIMILLVFLCFLPFKINAETNMKGYVTKADTLFMKEANMSLDSCSVKVNGKAHTNYGAPGKLHCLDSAEEITVLNYDSIIISTTDSCKLGYYYISAQAPDSNYYKGYVCADNVQVNIDINKYKKEFTEAGFPESYFEKLTVLKDAHPNWIFTAYKTNLNWNDVVKNESIVGMSYIQVTDMSKGSIYLSLEEGSYDPINKAFLIREGKNWYAANEKTVAYYLDPRNFLVEKEIFMFENLGYNSKYQTLEAIQNVLKNTDLYPYSKIYLEAATYNGNNINPISLAASSRQEVVLGNGKLSGSADGSGKKVFTVVKEPTKEETPKKEETTNKEDTSKKEETTNKEETPKKEETTNKEETPKKEETTNKEETPKKEETANKEETPKKEETTNKEEAPKTEQIEVSYYNVYNLGAFSSCVNPVACAIDFASGYADSKTPTTTFNRPWTTIESSIKNGAQYIGNAYINQKQNTVYFKKWNVTSNVYGNYSNQYMTNISAAVSEGKTAYEAYAKIDGLLDSAIEFIIPVYENMPAEISTLPTSIDKVEKDKKEEEAKKEEEEQTSPIVDIISRAGYAYNSDYLSGIKIGTTAGAMIANFKGIDSKVTVKITTVDSNGKTKEIIDSTVLGTGDIITISNGEDNKSFRIIIYGDVNGDGAVTAVDYVQIKNYIMSGAELQGSYKLAADVNKDSTISAVDYVNIKNYILGNDSVLMR